MHRYTGTYETQLIGFTLGDARKTALADGYTIDSIQITAPPKLQITEFDDSYRVLRVCIINDKSLKLLICKPL